MQDFGSVFGTYHCRLAKLSTYNCSMAGASTSLCDDSTSFFHHRLPIGRCGGSHQNIALSKLFGFCHAKHDFNSASTNFFSHRIASKQHFAFFKEAIDFKFRELLLAVHRLRPCLHHVEFAIDPIFCPLHIHRGIAAIDFAIVLFYFDCPVG